MKSFAMKTSKSTRTARTFVRRALPTRAVAAICGITVLCAAAAAALAADTNGPAAPVVTNATSRPVQDAAVLRAPNISWPKTGAGAGSSANVGNVASTTTQPSTQQPTSTSATATLASRADVVNAPSSSPAADAPAALPGARQETLADILGFDPIEVDAQRSREAAAAAREEAKLQARRDADAAMKAKLKERPSTEETLNRYEARLLADTRVSFGVTRTVDAPQPSVEEIAGKSASTPAPDAAAATARVAGGSRGKGLDAALTPDEMAILRHIRAEVNPNVLVLEDEQAGDAGTATVSVMTEQYGEMAAGATPQTRVSMQKSGGAFNSNAYGRVGADDVAGAAAAAQKEQEPTLELDDVEAFSRETERNVDESEDGALDADAVDPVVAESDEALVELEDECFSALDPYTSLLVAYEPTYEWTESILEYVESILRTLEDSPVESRALVAELKRKTQEADSIKKRLEAADQIERASRDPWNGGERPELSARYTLAQRLELVESFKNALERRIFLWNHAADFFAARSRGQLREPQDLTRQEMELLLKATNDVKAFFGDAANGRSWRASFDVDALADELRQALELPGDDRALAMARKPAGIDAKRATVGYLGRYAVSTPADPYLDKMLAEDDPVLDAAQKERERRMRFLHDRVNAIAYKIEKTPMTQEQRQVFNRPTLTAWANMIAGFAGDQTNGLALLVAFERYERTAGGHSGRTLQQTALRMTTSQSEICRLYGRAIDVIYDNPNVKAYVSEALINRLLPVRDPEFAVVQETVLNNPVVGNRRVDTKVSIKLQPDPNRLLMSLNIQGRVHANTSSAVFNAKLHNESYATYVGRKTLEWRDTGIAYSPASVNASTANRLDSVETDVDFLPIVGDLARGVTRSSYESRQGEIEAEAKAKVVNETRARFDKEANERFDTVNATLRNGFFRNMSNLGLSLRTQRSRTTEDWLLASMRFGADYALGCQATEPATLPGAFADIKIHESSINSFLTQLDLAGRNFTPRQTLDYIADRLNKPALKEMQIEESELSFTFAKTDPITARFFEDRACLVLRFENMTLGAKSWDNIEVQVAYRPAQTDDGAPAFIRDGAIELYGPASVMEQIPVRAVFSKIFPAQKSIDLRADMLSKDERFAGLALGLCRISKGWFAISVVKDSHYSHEIQKTYL